MWKRFVKSAMWMLASASICSAAVEPITSVTTDNPPGSPPYNLLSITIGAYTATADRLATGTTTFGSMEGTAAPENDDFDINTALNWGLGATPWFTVNFGGGLWQNSNGDAPDFILFESGGNGGDQPTFQAVFPDGSTGQGVQFPASWGPTGYNRNAAVADDAVDMNGQQLHGLAFSITDLLDAGGSPLLEDTVILGLQFERGGTDPVGLFAVVPPLVQARNPIPADNATDVSPDVVLAWEAGPLAVSHNVYFGTDFDAIEAATPASDLLVSQGQTETSFDPEGSLALGQTYYWRVDEVNDAEAKSPWKGSIWSFEVEPVSFAVPMDAIQATASSTEPGQTPDSVINGSGLDEDDLHGTQQETMWVAAVDDATPSIQFDFGQVEKLDMMRVWNHNTQTEAIVGFGIKEALIESSMDGETWTEVATVELAQAPGTAIYAGEEIPLSGVVAKAVKITALSNWSVLGLPQKGLSEVRFYAIPMRARLESPVSGATGLDPLVDLRWRAGREAVKHDVLMGTDPDALTLVATVDDAAYTASAAMDSLVYWQINEINDAMDPAVWEGQLWSMSTTGYVTVDDMESYTSADGSYVWETWLDGFDDNSNGALLGHGGDNMETDIAYDGAQSLPYYYGQGGTSSSEASRDIERDWSEHGIVSLSLMFYGAASNLPGQLYIKVNDEKIATYPTASDLTLPQWQAWTLDLPASALGQVKSLTIGVEGGTGLVLIDAIRLYSKASETIDPVMPDNAGLVAFYPFEGNASDASGNGNDGTLEGGPQFVTGKVGNALDFDGADDFVSTGKVASQLGIDGNKPRTVSAWVYTRGYANGGIFDVGARVAAEDFCLRTLNDVENSWRIQYWGGDQDFTLDTLERWVHFTHVHDGTHTQVYGDGRLIVNWEKTIDTTDTNPFQIGCYGWQVDFFNGVIDEVRVYNRALSQAEALGLAMRQDPIFKKL